MEQTRKVHKDYKGKMAVHMKKWEFWRSKGGLLKSSTTNTALQCLDIAEGLYIVGKTELELPSQQITTNQLAYAAIHVTFTELPANH